LHLKTRRVDIGANESCDSKLPFRRILHRENAWAREPERAQAFASSLDAAEFIREKDLHHAKVVLKFP
jgi:hypothetical protein